METIVVHIKLFATLRQQAGWSEQTIEISQNRIGDGSVTVRDVIETVDELTPTLQLAGRTIYAAVNQQYVKMEHPVQTGDIVAIFPPVSGGSMSGIECWI